MSSSGAAAGLGLLSAATWGGSDFAGGWGARRASSLLVTASGQIVSLLALLLVCLVLRLTVPGTSYLVYAAIGGFEGAIALAVFYRALSMGAMGLTAALTGLTTALVPVLFELVPFRLARRTYNRGTWDRTGSDLADFAFAGEGGCWISSTRIAAGRECRYRIRRAVDPLQSGGGGRGVVGPDLRQDCRSRCDPAGSRCSAAQGTVARILDRRNRLRVARYGRKPVLHDGVADGTAGCRGGDLLDVSGGNDSAGSGLAAGEAYEAAGSGHGARPGCCCAAERLSQQLNPAKTQRPMPFGTGLYPLRNTHVGALRHQNRVIPASGVRCWRGEGEGVFACSAVSSAERDR